MASQLVVFLLFIEHVLSRCFRIPGLTGIYTWDGAFYGKRKGIWDGMATYIIPAGKCESWSDRDWSRYCLDVHCDSVLGFRQSPSVSSVCTESFTSHKQFTRFITN